MCGWPAVSGAGRGVRRLWVGEVEQDIPDGQQGARLLYDLALDRLTDQRQGSAVDRAQPTSAVHVHPQSRGECRPVTPKRHRAVRAGTQRALAGGEPVDDTGAGTTYHAHLDDAGRLVRQGFRPGRPG